MNNTQQIVLFVCYGAALTGAFTLAASLALGVCALVGVTKHAPKASTLVSTKARWVRAGDHAMDELLYKLSGNRK